MNSCKEFVLDDLMAVVAIPVTDFNPGTAAWQLQPVIDSELFDPTLTNAIVIGRQPVPESEVLIPIMRGTGKVKDDESDSVSGRLHTVKVTCNADDRDSEVWNHLLTLERTPCHLLLTYRDGIKAFVQATEDTYLCNAERDGSKTSITLRVQNIMGAQLIA